MMCYWNPRFNYFNGTYLPNHPVAVAFMSLIELEIAVALRLIWEQLPILNFRNGNARCYNAPHKKAERKLTKSNFQNIQFIQHISLRYQMYWIWRCNFLANCLKSFWYYKSLKNIKMHRNKFVLQEIVINRNTNSLTDRFQNDKI